MKYITTIKDQEFVIEIDHDKAIVVNGEQYAIDFHQLPDGDVTSLLLNHRSFEAVIEERENTWEVLLQGELYSVSVLDERAYRLAKARGGETAVHGDAVIKSPMPGIIIATPVGVGDKVNKGDKVIILESMKMENELRAPRDGVVARLQVQSGDSVEKDQVLVVITAPAGEDNEK